MDRIPLSSISIHALLAESDSRGSVSMPRYLNFYPRSPCGERQALHGRVIGTNGISIHALLAESDCFARCHCWGLNEFLSTLSLRRATQHSEPDSGRIRFLSTLSLRRATRSGGPWQAEYTISIHALLAESDQAFHAFPLNNLTFLSTLSLRRATLNCSRNGFAILYFYPRSPCGERLADTVKFAGPMLFLSTLSLRRATESQPLCARPTKISIHALLAESDSREKRKYLEQYISIHALLAESDAHHFSTLHNILISIHALLAESDIGTLRTVSVRKTFLSTLSLRRATEQSSSYSAYLEISIHALLAESDYILCAVSVQIGGFLSTLSLRRATQKSCDRY